jgi:DNA-binding response OmpR family regulator
MKQIQIIEDDPDIVELVRYNLAQEGFQVSILEKNGRFKLFSYVTD